MASKFTGRDYSTLREEIIEFWRQRLPQDWDYTNLADPMVVCAESIAQLGDNLHYTIDELRRECDVATAKRASSIYSYAMREGYKMMLPKSSSGVLAINTSKEQSGCLHLALKQFDEIRVSSTGDTLYVADANREDGYAFNVDLYAPIDKNYVEDLSKYADDDGNIDAEKRNIYAAYVDDTYNKTPHIHTVLGKKETFYFSYSDINNDSTVDLPNPLIDRSLVRLTVKNSSTPSDSDGEELTYVDDVIASGFNRKSYTLTPKFIGGAITLSIEFPTNYRDIFNNDASNSFTFEYISIQNSRIDANEENSEAIDLSDYITIKSGYESTPDIVENGIKYLVDLGNGIKGYAEYEDPIITRENYKKFVQDYSSLLTKADYESYIKATTSLHCKVFDHHDNYKNPPVLPAGTQLLERTVYVLSDAPYSLRESMWNDLRERSSRSDCIVPVPFGKDPYTIIVKAECYLLGTSVSTVATQIKSALLKYYADSVGERIPDKSMIDYISHKASDAVIRMDSLIVRDSTYGTIDTTFNDVANLSNEDIDNLYKALETGDVSFHVDILHEGAESEYNTIEHKYYLLGSFPNPFATPPGSNNAYYNKYPIAKKSDNTNGYDKFPESFPGIYYVNGHTETLVDTYEELIDHQVVYGELDSKDWDFVDSDIFNTLQSRNQLPYNPDPDSGNLPDGVKATAQINQYYKEHHYMVPVLNNVVVLIKAVTK